MGLVLAFQTPRPASRPPQRRTNSARSADVLFFTGVRYEREPAPARPTTPDRTAAERIPPAS
ncbi:hypothetical protein [Hansschlegelia sp.]|uniref:hypothetical protein n=1 Tax=Hansschlegelia sp. TaxID=2041892 RepID=UPI002CC4FB37|nr:hypothetical protein [Hansschlegelia sp.]HVI28147.1 hypothetical protein [Hansschlegelia sp.]